MTDRISIAKALFFVIITIGFILFGMQYGDEIDKRVEAERAASEKEASKAEEELLKGLVMKDVVVGTGPEAETGDTVVVHYTGTFEDGQVFDSSHNRGTPFPFTIGIGQVIRGWEIGVRGMHVGGTRELTIPPSLAYGESGFVVGGQEFIPPNATLHFEVQLVEIQGKEQ